MNTIFYILLFILFSLQSCRHTLISNEQEYLNWLRNEKNNLIKTKYINNLKISARFLPAEYLVYKEIKGDLKKENRNHEIDSLLNIYSQSLTFIITISPDDREGEQFDIMYFNIENKEDYYERAHKLNFNISEYISLTTRKSEYAPVLHTLENTYGLSNSRNIYIVFSETADNGDLFSSKTLDLVFNDLIFETGISHFIFKKFDLTKIPKIDFWQTL